METSMTPRGSYTDVEAASLLGISVQELHRLLRDRIFSPEEPAPDQMVFLPQDLVMLECWLRQSKARLLHMPDRIQ
jgi:hypothetical protein